MEIQIKLTDEEIFEAVENYIKKQHPDMVVKNVEMDIQYDKGIVVGIVKCEKAKPKKSNPNTMLIL
jgi:hypothetical protein